MKTLSLQSNVSTRNNPIIVILKNKKILARQCTCIVINEPRYHSASFAISDATNPFRTLIKSADQFAYSTRAFRFFFYRDFRNRHRPNWRANCAPLRTGDNCARLKIRLVVCKKERWFRRRVYWFRFPLTVADCFDGD